VLLKFLRDMYKASTMVCTGEKNDYVDERW